MLGWYDGHVTDHPRPSAPGRVFRRSAMADPPVAVRAEGSTIWDADGRAYLDAAGGAIVVNVGHGRREIAAAMADQAGRLAYAHGSAFTTEPLERYAAAVAPHLPVDGPVIYPVSGGSEAIETALKLARTYHIARGEPDRWIVFSRWGSYHGNTLGALDLSGRKPLRRPYEGWLGRFRHLSAAYPYRGGEPGSNALAGADDLAAELEAAIEAAGPGTVAAFVARAGRRGDPGGRRPAGRLLAEDRRGLPPSRRAAHRRRGHDRVRADRALVRARSLGCPARHPRRGQGRDVRLLAVRVRRDVERDPRHHRRRPGLRPRVHVLARAGRRGGRERGPAHPRDGGPGGGERVEGGAAQGRPDRRARRPPGGRRDPRPRPAGRHRARGGSRDPDAVSAGGQAHRGRRPRGARARPPRLLGDWQRRRDERRHDPARAALRRSRTPSWTGRSKS